MYTQFNQISDSNMSFRIKSSPFSDWVSVDCHTAYLNVGYWFVFLVYRDFFQIV